MSSTSYSISRASVLLVSALASSCSRREPTLDPVRARAALSTYAEIASAAYEDALASARALKVAVDAFSAAPDDATLRAAREAWKAARRPYLQTEAYRFYAGPIDRVEMLVNTWPIDENYVEATPDAVDRGIIDDPARYPTLDAALLRTLNAQAGETSISTGYHVIEFLLWGRDESEAGPGARSPRDFVGPGLAERRRLYLQLASALLVEHLEQVVSAWAGDYRKELLTLPPAQAVGRALQGMGALSGPELSGERLTVPYETRDQENEQSCFSDTTHLDVRLDALGVQNVCLGQYQRTTGQVVRGPGLCALIGSLNAELGAKLEQQIRASVAAANTIPEPFDRALSGPDDAPGRRAIKATIGALQAQTESIASAAAALGVGIDTTRLK